MPIDIEPKKLKIAFMFVNCYVAILAVSPLIVLLEIVLFVYYLVPMFLINGLFVAVCFVVFARFWFNKHREINYLFMGKYDGADREKLMTLFYIPPSIIERVYGKLPLPLFNLSKHVTRGDWRRK